MEPIELRIFAKLILWELMIIATIEGFNTSHGLSSEHLVRHKRESPEILKLRYYDENQVKLIPLRKVIDSVVASTQVPICNIQSIDEYPSPYHMDHVQPVFYHGVNSYSAITHFPHTNTLHGVIDQSFYIDNLPLNDASDPNVVARFIHPMSNRLSLKNERSRSSRQTNPQYGDRKFETNGHCSRERNWEENDPETPKKILYPEILLIVDTSSEIDFHQDNETRYEKVIMYAYAYWNAVDMLFRNLKRTNIKINISGIDVGTTIAVVNEFVNLDYYVENSYVFIPKTIAFDSLGRSYHTRDQIIRNSFDFIIWMTSGKLTSHGGVHRGRYDLAITAKPTSCGGLREHELDGKVSNRAIIMHDDKYGDYQIAARELAHLMFVANDDVKVFHDSHRSNCLSSRPKAVASGIMNPLNKCVESSLMWSFCSEIHFERYARSASSCCLLNYPYVTMGTPNPLKLLTVESQCKCYGMKTDSPVNDNENICNEMLECKNTKGDYKSIGLPLDGTKCRNNDEAYCILGICQN